MERAPKTPPAMCCRIRKGFAPRNRNAIKAWVISKIPASNPPQKIAANARGGAPATVSGTGEAVEVVILVSPLEPKKDTSFENSDRRHFIPALKPFGNPAPSN